MQWGFWDQQHWQPCAAIATGDDVHPNEAGIAYQNIYHEFIRTKLVLEPVRIQGGEAVFEFRGFQGTYDVALVDGETGEDLRSVNSGMEVEQDAEFRL